MGYTARQVAALREKAQAMAEEAIFRQGISDPDGTRTEKLAWMMWQNRDEWAGLITQR